MKIILCPCGSGADSWWEHDARGIPLARVCTKCRATKLKKYRPDVLTEKQMRESRFERDAWQQKVRDLLRTMNLIAERADKGGRRIETAMQACEDIEEMAKGAIKLAGKID